jgi:hypothetical protein
MLCYVPEGITHLFHKLSPSSGFDCITVGTGSLVGCVPVHYPSAGLTATHWQSFANSVEISLVPS